MSHFTILPDRGVITVSGADRASFLQGLVSNDVDPALKGKPVWAAFLTPQGKYRHDFFVIAQGDTLLLDCEGGDRLMDLGTSLRRFVLRSDVSLGIDANLACATVWGDGVGFPAPAVADGIVFADPRLAAMGYRVLGARDALVRQLSEAGFNEASHAAWDAHRIRLGVPDGARDMQAGKATLLENGFEELNGVDWQKGCYMGQELTARTKYRGLVKKRLLPVRLEGMAPPEGTSVTAENKDAGVLYSIAGDRGLALLRLEKLNGAPLIAGDAVLTPEIPDWIDLP